MRIPRDYLHPQAESPVKPSLDLHVRNTPTQDILYLQEFPDTNGAIANGNNPDVQLHSLPQICLLENIISNNLQLKCAISSGIPYDSSLLSTDEVLAGENPLRSCSPSSRIPSQAFPRRIREEYPTQDILFLCRFTDTNSAVANGNNPDEQLHSPAQICSLENIISSNLQLTRKMS